MKRPVPVVGQLREQRLLGSRAVYRVVLLDGDHVHVAVETCPGLAPGTELRLTRAAVEAMTPSAAVDAASDDELQQTLARWAA